MDDRTWTAGSAKRALDPVECWAGVSGDLMLKENPAKIQLAARNKQGREELRREVLARAPELEDKIKDDLEILGMETVAAQGRVIGKKEKERVDAAHKTIMAINCLPLTRKGKESAIRGLGLPKLMYG